MKHLVACVLVCVFSVTAFAALPRPKTPNETTLASPTSQIAAWYRYAVSLEGDLTLVQQQLTATVAEFSAYQARAAADLSVLKAQLSAEQARTARLDAAILAMQTAVNRVVLTWDRPSDPEITGYVVERSADGVEYTELTRLPADARYFRHDRVEAGTMWYRVRSVSVGGVSSPSNVVVAHLSN